MKPKALDHVALFVSEPESAASKLLARLPFRVLERTDEFVLVGRSPDLGKLTLFAADGPRERGALMRLGIGIPCGTASTAFELDDELHMELVPSAPAGEVDLDHVALRAREPQASAEEWVRYGFERASPVGGAQRVRLGSAFVELHPGAAPRVKRPLLNHLGLLVDSIEDVQRSVAEHGFDVRRDVEAASSHAVFVDGPDGVEIEYIEHKPSFALA